MMHRLGKGFTIVELLVVIVVISILATIGVASYGSWRERTAKKVVSSDLLQVASAFKTKQNFSNDYPSNFSGIFTPSPDVILKMTNAGSGAFCINGYSKKFSSVQLSISSSNTTTVSESLCSGAVIDTIGS